MKDFKAQVIAWAKKYNPDIGKYKITERKHRRYGMDIRIYTGDYMEITNKKSSFRREHEVIDKTDEQGRTIKSHYEGTRGHHTTRIACSILINEEDWDFGNKKPKDEEFIVFMDSGIFPNYKELTKLKT